MNHRRWLYLAIAIFLILISFVTIGLGKKNPISQFDGDRAYQDLVTQTNYGPRTPGSAAHNQMVDWLVFNLTQQGWIVEVQEIEYQGQPVRNVIAKRGTGNPWIILGAHYDSRLVADQDEDVELSQQPVLGANDGASGVAVLLELARILPDNLAKADQVWLVFFDSEDQGNLPGWDWIYGSRAFVEDLQGVPSAMVLVDMIGDVDLNIFQEKNSDEELTRQIWETAAALGYQDHFIQQPKYRILDDHIPFLQNGIPAVDIIDFDYTYWHTSQDTADKVSAESLEIVGKTLLTWLTTP